MIEIERFWSKVDFTDSCWLWTAGTQQGYGHFTVEGGDVVKAHRYAYKFCVGPVPKGLQLDHLCRVRNCVRPDHLEPVTRKENILRGVSFSAINARKTHCLHGHEFTLENTYRQHGGRGCRTCANVQQRARRAAAIAV